MLTRPFRPPEMPGLMPYLTVADPEKSMAFYQSAFNFKPATEPMLQDGKIMHAEMRFLDNRIMLGPVGAFGSQAQTPKSTGSIQGASVYIYCEDVDAQFQRAEEAGAEITSPVADMFWGDRIFQVADLDGYRWTFAQNVADFDPANAPG